MKYKGFSTTKQKLNKLWESISKDDRIIETEPRLSSYSTDLRFVDTNKKILKVIIVQNQVMSDLGEDGGVGG